jgi:hypothetical protein
MENLLKKHENGRYDINSSAILLIVEDGINEEIVRNR